MSAAPRQLHLNAFLMTVGHQESAWRFPQTSLSGAWDVAHYRHPARAAERGTLRGHYGLPRPTNQFTTAPERSGRAA